jgi:serine/threonine protein kinase
VTNTCHTYPGRYPHSGGIRLGSFSKHASESSRVIILVLWLKEGIGNSRRECAKGRELYMAAANESRRSRGLSLSLPRRDSVPQPLPLPPPSADSSLHRFRLPSIPAQVRNLSLDDLDLDRKTLLGAGSGGKVYRVAHRQTGRIYALKVIQEKHELAVRNQIVREMEILLRAKSPHLVECYGVFDRGGEVSFVLEFMDGGTLADVLKFHKKISERYLAEVTKQVLLGLRYLHKHKIVHRDIKPSNLLINRRQEVKIADFGVSTVLAHTLAQCNSFVGTCAYMSPERFDPDGNGGEYGYSADIWSLGLTLLECAIGRFPCLQPGEKPDWPTLMCAICLGDPPSPPPDASPEFKNFIVCCLQKDAVRRPSAEMLLTHPFVKNSELQPCPVSDLLQGLVL